jgi:hypothetical protein
MPLEPGTSRETISSNIRDTLESPTFGRGKSRKKRREMAAAASYRKARESGTKLPRKKRNVSQAAVAKRT